MPWLFASPDHQFYNFIDIDSEKNVEMYTDCTDNLANNHNIHILYINYYIVYIKHASFDLRA